MEQVKQDAFDNARLEVIKDGYDRAFECINEALTADEAGDKTRALDLYKRGLQHLLRAISVPSRGEECIGSSWESVRQMQQKMQETLNNITTRLARLETSVEVGATSAGGVSHPSAPDMSAESLNPTKAMLERPVPPNLLSPSSQPAGAVGGSTKGPSTTRHPLGLAEQPPVYSPQAADGHLSISYGTNTGEMPPVGNEFFSHTSNSTPSPQSLSEDGEELLSFPHGVQVFFVTPEGQVSAPSYPGYLRLVRFTSDHSDRMPNRPPAFLQVCDWLYPLMKTFPVLLCNTGVFMFPDMMAPAPGYYLGVVLSAELPAADRRLFQDLLTQMTDFRVQAPDEAAESINLSQSVSVATPKETVPEETVPEETVPEETVPEETVSEETVPEETVPEETVPEETVPEETVPEETVPEETVPEETVPEETVPEETVPEEAVPEETEEENNLPEWSEKVASGILTAGTSWLKWGLVKGAEYTGVAIHKGASKLREHITPEDKPTHVSPTVTKSLHVAQQATGGAVKVRQFLVDRVCAIAGHVGKELAPHVKKHGGKLIPELLKDKDGCSNMGGAMVVAASGVEGFAAVWTGLKVAAKNITTSVAAETVATVKHKYGAAAGQATDHAVNAAINVGTIALNVDNLDFEAVLKRAGKQTAKALLKDDKIQEKPGKQVEKSDK